MKHLIIGLLNFFSVILNKIRFRFRKNILFENKLWRAYNIISLFPFIADKVIVIVKFQIPNSLQPECDNL